MVCSRQPWTIYSWPLFLIKTGNCVAELYSQTPPADMTHPAHPRNLQQNVLRAGMTSLLHPTPAKISSRHIPTSLRVLVNFLELITSLSVMVPNLWYMCPESVQLLCNPWCMRNSVSSLTKVSLFWLKSVLIGSVHLPTLGRQMGSYESVWTQRILIQLLDVITTKPLQWKKSPMN